MESTHRKKEEAISRAGKRPRAEEMKSHQLATGAMEVEQKTQIEWEAGMRLGRIWAPALSRLTLASQGLRQPHGGPPAWPTGEEGPRAQGRLWAAAAG